MDVQENRALLTRADFKFFLDAVATEEDAALVDAKRIAKATFQYDELSAGDPDAGRASKAAYYAVVQELETMVAERRFTPDARMTPQEINAAAKELIAGQQEAFILGLRLDYEAYVAKKNQDLSGVGLVLDPADPIASLDAWWSNPDTDQTAQRTNYGMIKRDLMFEYINKGVLN